MISFIEKYRPYWLSDLVLPQETENYIKAFVYTSKLPKNHYMFNKYHLLISGEPGIGKTSAARCMAREIINCNNNSNNPEVALHNEREFYRNHVFEFKPESMNSSDIVSKLNSITRYINGSKSEYFVLIVDEIDEINIGCQNNILQFIKTIDTSIWKTNKITGDTPDIASSLLGINSDKKILKIILTCNNLSAIMESIQSYCSGVRFRPLSIKEIEKCLKKICQTENLQITENSILDIAEKSHGDIRAAINTLGKATDYAKSKKTIVTENIVKEANEGLIIINPQLFLRALINKEIQSIDSILALDTTYQLTHILSRIIGIIENTKTTNEETIIISNNNVISIPLSLQIELYKIIEICRMECSRISCTKIQILGCVAKMMKCVDKFQLCNLVN